MYLSKRSKFRVESTVDPSLWKVKGDRSSHEEFVIVRFFTVPLGQCYY